MLYVCPARPTSFMKILLTYSDLEKKTLNVNSCLLKTKIKVFETNFFLFGKLSLSEKRTEHNHRQRNILFLLCVCRRRSNWPLQKKVSQKVFKLQSVTLT